MAYQEQQQQQQKSSKSGMVSITKKVMIGTVITQLTLLSSTSTTTDFVVNGQSIASVLPGSIVSVPSSSVSDKIMKNQNQNQNQQKMMKNSMPISKSNANANANANANSAESSVVYYPNHGNSKMKYKNVIEAMTDAAESSSSSENNNNIFKISKNSIPKSEPVASSLSSSSSSSVSSASTRTTIDLLDNVITTTEPKVMYGGSSSGSDNSVMSMSSSESELESVAKLWDQDNSYDYSTNTNENNKSFEKLIVYPTIGLASALGLVGLVNYTQKKYQEYKMNMNMNMNEPLLASTRMVQDGSDPFANAFQNVEGGAMMGQGETTSVQQQQSSSSSTGSSIMSGVYAIFGGGGGKNGTTVKKTISNKVGGGTGFFSSSSNKKSSSVVEAEEEDPNQFFSDDLQDTLNEIFLLFMRIGVASMMLHHGQEKIMSAELFDKYVMLEYFSWLPGPAELYTYSAGYLQLVGPVFLALGVFSRFASAGMAGTMLGAYYYHFNSTGFEGFPLSKIPTKVPVFHNYAFETPTLYFVIFLYFAVHGPGKYSIANALGWTKDKSLKGLFKQ